MAGRTGEICRKIEGQTKLMLQVEETRPTKETSGRSSTMDKQKPRLRLVWNKLKELEHMKGVNMDNAEGRCRIGFERKTLA